MLDRYGELLGTLQSLSPMAHIGGGAVRDTLLGRPIRDIDIFLEDSVIEGGDGPGVLRSRFGFVMVGEWKSYEMFSDPAVTCVARFEKADETIPVCLIGLKRAQSIADNLRRFDFGICMAAWDGDEVHTAAEYVADAEARRFTLHRADNLPQLRYSMSRYRKMTADRYAGWALAIPDRFASLKCEYDFARDHYRDYGTGDWICQLVDNDKNILTPKPR
jgi:hypothetical protein